MFRSTAMLMLLLSLAALGGCKTPEQMKAEYPDWPNWGWWDNPAEPTEQSESAQSAVQPPPASGADGELADANTLQARGDETARVDAPAEPSAADSLSKRDPLAEHRQDVWVTVSKFRSFDGMTNQQRAQLLDQARRNLDAWYAPMPVDAPEADSSDWITVLIWDFMPEKEFQRAVEGCRAIASRENRDFPVPVTRRAIMTFIATLGEPTDAEAQPQPEEAAEPVEPTLEETDEDMIVVEIDRPAGDEDATSTPPAEDPPAETEMDTPDE